MAETCSENIQIGLLPVLDPRIWPDLEKRTLERLALEEKLRSLGFEVIWPGRAVSTEEDAVEQVQRMKAAGACGIVYFTGRVHAQEEIDRILSRTLMIKGVKDVRSSVVIGK